MRRRQVDVCVAHKPMLSFLETGHRLKSANNKTTAMFKSLNTRRRVILSGTPIQNDLGEFHAMVGTDPIFLPFSLINNVECQL